MIKMI